MRSSLKTVDNQQFLTWYGRHQYDAAVPYNNTIWIGRRTLGTSQWEIFRHPAFTANNIADGHDVISYGIDGDGYMHVSWGMHGDAFHYSRSVLPVTGSGPIVLGPDGPMSGSESTVNYPQFLKLPDGDLLFLFPSGYQTNNMLCFGRSTDAGLTWQRFDGAPYSLPISRDAESGVEATRADTIVNIPEGSSLINQASMCLDHAGNPVTATWRAPDTSSGNFRRQYMVVFRHDYGTWQTRTVSNRTNNPSGTRYSESAVRDLGRPIVVNDDENHTEVSITIASEPSWSYRLWSSTNFDDWELVETRDGTGQPIVFTRPAVAGETKRFWCVEFVEGGF